MDLKPYNVNAVLRNIENVFKSGEIYKLNQTGYNFLDKLFNENLMSGFIAHYNLSGFQATYTDLRLLLNDIKDALPIERDVAERDLNDPQHNGYGLPYCQSKLDIINGLEKIVERYTEKIEIDFKEAEKQKIKQKIQRLQERLATL